MAFLDRHQPTAYRALPAVVKEALLLSVGVFRPLSRIVAKHGRCGLWGKKFGETPTRGIKLEEKKAAEILMHK